MTLPSRSAQIALYLSRLGIPHPGRPSVAALFALHRAHVEAIPYEVIDVQLGRPGTVEPDHCLDRVLRGRGGYCVELNTAFSVLLAELGYDVTRHAAGVQASATAPLSDAEFAPHMALSVRLEGTRWLVDVGLGDGLYEPLPARPGCYRQRPFSYRLSPSEAEPGGLRFDHDLRGSVVGLDIRLVPACQQQFSHWHDFLVTSPESRLARTLTVMRRDAVSAYGLTGCLLWRVDGAGRTVREITDRQDWLEALTATANLRLTDFDPTAQDFLWTKVRSAHEQWLERKAASPA